MPAGRSRIPAGWFPLAVGSVALVAAMPVGAQVPELQSFRDSLVVRQVAFQAPCPDPAPSAWSARDSLLARGWRCSLVEHAARAVRQYLGLRGGRDVGDPWRPLCVRLVVGRNTGSTGLPGDWLVVFDLTVEQSAYVVIDRQSGGIGAVSTDFGARRPGHLPDCAG